MEFKGEKSKINVRINVTCVKDLSGVSFSLGLSAT